MKNICKFADPGISISLNISRFILETNPDVMAKPVVCRDHRMLLVIRGEGSFLIDGTRFPFRQGQLFLILSGEQLIVRQENGCEYMYIDFSGSRAQELMRRFGIRPARRCFDGFDGMIPLWKESLSRAPEQSVDLAAESMLLYGFSRLSGQADQRGSLVNRAMEITEQEFSDPSFSLALLAQRLGYNAKYLSHVFKSSMGLNYCEYLRSLRIKHAVSLFDLGIDSVKNVALLSGFSDPLYFSSVFKKAVGLSPTAYISHRPSQPSGED